MGDSGKFVRAGIESMVQNPIKYFSMIRQDGEKMYICMGKRALFLIDFEPPKKEAFFYAWIEEVIADKDNLLLFEIGFSEGRQSLILESFEREKVLDEIAICWKADYMFRLWKWDNFPLKIGSCQVKRREKTAEEFTAPPTGMQRCQFSGYFWFAEDTFIPEISKTTGKPTGKFKVEAKENNLQAIVHKPHAVAMLGRKEKDNLRLAVERIAREAGSVDSEAALLRSEQYHKKMNLVGDLASWTAWAVHLRTNVNDYGVIGVRRKFIPPIGDTYQDIFTIYQGEPEQFGEPKDFMEDLQRMVDTMCPVVRVLFYDDTICRIKADALLYDEDSYSWFYGQGIISSNDDAARALYKSIVGMLAIEKQGDFKAEEVEIETMLVDDPFTIIKQISDEAPGLREEDSRIAWENWRRRVSRYFCWVVDGGLHPGELELNDLAKCEQLKSCTMHVRDTFQRLFDYFMYMTANGQPYELDGMSLGDKVSDENFMKGFMVNNRALIVLLQNGYIQRTLEEEQPPKFIPFLSRMLHRPFEETRQELLVELCNQIAILSYTDFQRQSLIEEHVVLPLIELLRSEDDVLLLSVARALINLCCDKEGAKESVVNEGGTRSLVPHLLNKTEELTRAFCTLLKNCLTQPELRDRINNDGVIPPLLTLMKDSKIEGAQRSDAVIASAAAALWNVAAHDAAKTNIQREGGVEIILERLKKTKSVEIQQKCCGALMTLSANNDKIKEQMGSLDAVRIFVEILNNASDKNVLKAVLGALTVLSAQDELLAQIRSEGVEAQLDKCMKLKDPKVHVFIARLKEQLYAKATK